MRLEGTRRVKLAMKEGLLCKIVFPSCSYLVFLLLEQVAAHSYRRHKAGIANDTPYTEAKMLARNYFIVRSLHLSTHLILKTALLSSALHTCKNETQES